MGRKKAPRIKRDCKTCNNSFEVRASLIAIGKGLFCSHSCKGKASALKPEDLFNRNINSIDDCLEYKVGSNNGYGVIRIQGKQVLAHRFAYELYYGKIPAGMFVLHSCDNRKCVRKEHLSLGTLADNNHDRDNKGRFTILHGSLNGQAILNEEQVKEIKQLIIDGLSNREICFKYGVDHSTISKIRTGKHWRRVV